jgi:glutathione synthase/RimK-type ligase-like ATP-grasp enzyme
MKTVAFATYHKTPGLTADDALVIPFLIDCNIEVVPAVWDDPGIQWNQFQAIIIRSCWDYHLNEKKFRVWLKHLKEAEIKVWNPVDILCWNMNKSYLRDLARKGIAIPRTSWIEPGASVDLQELMKERSWTKAVIKPVVSATAYRTWGIEQTNTREYQRHLEEILQFSGAMVQQFLPEVSSDGEWSFLFFNGQFSHAVKKRAKEGDFRVQSQFGGSVLRENPPESLVCQAERIVKVLECPLLYARVDGIEQGSGLLLIELELIEPELFLRMDPSAPEKFSRAISDILEL